MAASLFFPLVLMFILILILVLLLSDIRDLRVFRGKSGQEAGVVR